MDKLYDRLVSYGKEDYYPMHMPGHKRNTKLMQMVNPYQLDITEIEGFDNLHQAQGILKSLSERLCKLYDSGRSFPLVNGSTVGILAGICAVCSLGDKVLIARNCHKSIYHAVVLKGLIPVYCYPPQMEEIPVYGGISPQEIESLLIKEEDIKLVVVTSPTYEGIVSDIKGIADVVHRHGAALLVDEAHGAHFGFHKAFPQSAVRMGADLVIQSLHKTLPALTQSAVLHSNQACYNDKIQKYLAIYESSSPSYLLMAGIDRLVSMLEKNAGEYFEDYHKRLSKLYKSMSKLEKLKVLTWEPIGIYNIFDIDASKITVSVKDTALTGHQLLTILREKYHIVMEMETPDYVLGMTSICDTEEGFHRLKEALLEIDKELVDYDRASDRQDFKKTTLDFKETALDFKETTQDFKETALDFKETTQDLKETTLDLKETEKDFKKIAVDYKNSTADFKNKVPDVVMTPGQAVEAETEKLPLRNSMQRISAAFVCMYPPGSPLLVPGERIDQEMISYIKWLQQEGITVSGLSGEHDDEIEVVSNNR